jgi:hypothetical protein
MNGTTDARGAIRDLFQFHFGSHAWVPVMLALVVVSTLVVLLSPIPFNPPGPGYMWPTFRTGLVYRAVICWVISTVCAYTAGFIMGRLYVPRSAR